MEAVIFPLPYDEANHRFELVLRDGVFDVLQTVFFTAEKFVNGTELHSISGHRFAKLESFRDMHLLEQTESINLDISELHLMHIVLNPVAGYLPSVGHKFQDPMENLDNQQRTKLKAVANDLKRIFEVIVWVPDPKKI